MSSGKVVLVTGTSLVPAEVVSLIEKHGYAVRHVENDELDADELAGALEGVSGYLIGGNEEPLASHFEQARTLEAVAWIGTDYQGYVPGWRRAVELGVAFINTPGDNAASVAEFTTLLMLTMARPFISRVAAPGEWQPGPGYLGHELRDATLGIIGLGRIGATVARIAKLGLGMRIFYHAPRRKPGIEHALGIGYRDKGELLAESDFITLHRPGLLDGEPAEFGPPEAKTVRENAVLVNTGHLDLVDLEALLWAAKNRGVRAAFDDVGSGPFWDALVSLGPARFLAVPQMGYQTATANLRASRHAVEAVCDVLAGGTHDLVNNRDFATVRAASVTG